LQLVLFRIDEVGEYPQYKTQNLTRMPRPISKPHPKWNKNLTEPEREETWKFAAGKDQDKSPSQHRNARTNFIRNANEDSAEAKGGVGLNDKDRAVLKKKQDRLSRYVARNRVRRDNPEYRDKKNAHDRAWKDVPENYAKVKAYNRAYDKEKAIALQTERAAESKANGAGRTTDFGLGDVSREDELECGAYDIMNNPAGVLHPKGEATTANWIKDHGTKSIEELLATGGMGSVFLCHKAKDHSRFRDQMF